MTQRERQFKALAEAYMRTINWPDQDLCRGLCQAREQNKTEETLDKTEPVE